MINHWAARHNIPPAALAELLDLLGAGETPPESPEDLVTEAGAQQQVRIEASRVGIRLWRNNNGATFDEESQRLVRFGLGNESDKLSKRMKSSDLVGITPYEVTLADVGRRLGVFTAYEMKRPGWKYAGTKREIGQLRWGELVISLGGFFKFSTGEL